MLRIDALPALQRSAPCRPVARDLIPTTLCFDRPPLDIVMVDFMSTIQARACSSLRNPNQPNELADAWVRETSSRMTAVGLWPMGQNFLWSVKCTRSHSAPQWAADKGLHDDDALTHARSGDGAAFASGMVCSRSGGCSSDAVGWAGECARRRAARGVSTRRAGPRLDACSARMWCWHLRRDDACCRWPRRLPRARTLRTVAAAVADLALGFVCARH